MERRHQHAQKRGAKRGIKVYICTIFVAVMLQRRGQNDLGETPRLKTLLETGVSSTGMKRSGRSVGCVALSTVSALHYKVRTPP